MTDEEEMDAAVRFITKQPFPTAMLIMCVLARDDRKIFDCPATTAWLRGNGPRISDEGSLYKRLEKALRDENLITPDNKETT